MRILLVEDRTDTTTNILEEVNKYSIVDVAYSGNEGAYMSQVNDYDVILLDSELPDMDGSDLCKLVRTSNVDSPILFLSDKDDLEYKIHSLDSGADCYLRKPVNSEELNAQIRVLTRKSDRQSITTIKGLAIDLRNREVRYKSICVSLRRKEYEILEYLVINAGYTVSKEKLLEHVWDIGVDVVSNTLEVHIRNLRDKLQPYLGRSFIRTISGFGYRIERDRV
jgi:DNA-binding response OmpR family regulator